MGAILTATAYIDKLFNDLLDKLGFLDTVLGNGTLDTNGILTSLTPSALIIDSPTLIDNIKGLYGYFTIILIGLTFIYFCINLNDQYVLGDDELHLKNMAFPFLKLAIAIIIFSNSSTIITYLISLNNSIITTLGSKTFANSNTITASTSISNNILEEYTFIEKFLFIIPLLLCWGVSFGTKLAWTVKTLLYKIEFLIRIGYAPFSFVDMYSNNHSTFIRWVKGFLGFSLYGVGLILIPKITAAIAVDVFTAFTNSTSIGGGIFNFAQFISFCLMVPVAALGTLNNVKSAANEAVQNLELPRLPI